VTSARSTPNNERKVLLGTLFALGSGSAAAAAVALVDGPEGLGVSMSIILFALVVISGAFPPDSDGRDLGDPAFLAGAAMFLSFGLRGLSVVAHEVPVVGPGANLPGYGTFSSTDALAMCLAVVGWLMFVLAYRLPIGRTIGGLLPDLRLGRSRIDAALILSIGLAGVGWAARIVLFVQRPLTFDTVAADTADATQTLLVWLTGLTPVALALAFLRISYFPRALPVIAWAAALLALEAGMGLVTGSRTQVVGAIVTPFAVISLSGHLKFSARYIILVPVVIAAFGFTYIYRTLPYAPTRDLGGVMGRVVDATAAAVEVGPVGLAQAGIENVSNRYNGLDSVREILDSSRPVAYTWGARYLAAVPAAILPRFLWADKPYDTEGQDFARDYFGVPSDANTWFTATWIGDLLLNGPVPFILVGMAVMGGLFRVLREYVRTHRRTAHMSIVLYAVILPAVIQSDAWIFPTIWQVTRACLVVAAIALAVTLLARDDRAREHMA
jgi:hypothetical protein